MWKKVVKYEIYMRLGQYHDDVGRRFWVFYIIRRKQGFRIINKNHVALAVAIFQAQVQKDNEKLLFYLLY